MLVLHFLTAMPEIPCLELYPSRECHLKILLDCQKKKKKSLPDDVHVNKVSINVIQHDDRLLYLRLFYNGAFSIPSKHDFD
jgi:hypothetical protein